MIETSISHSTDIIEKNFLNEENRFSDFQPPQTNLQNS